MAAVDDSAPASRRFAEALARLSAPARADRAVPRVLVRAAARAVRLDPAGLDARGRRRSRHHRPVRAGRHALHDQVPVGAAGRCARRAGALAPARAAARLARVLATAADGGDRVPRAHRSRQSAVAGRARRGAGRGRFGHAGHRDRCVPRRDPEAERTGRRHGVVRRGLPDRHADLDRRRAVPRQRLRELSASPRTAPGRRAISRWRPAC